MSRTPITYYVLDADHNPQVVNDIEEWGRFFHSEQRRVACDFIGDVRVSTMFLGIDHSYTLDGPPILFETMVFRGDQDQYQERCATWDEAVAQHARVVAMVRRSL